MSIMRCECCGDEFDTDFLPSYMVFIDGEEAYVCEECADRLEEEAQHRTRIWDTPIVREDWDGDGRPREYYDYDRDD